MFLINSKYSNKQARWSSMCTINKSIYIFGGEMLSDGDICGNTDHVYYYDNRNMWMQPKWVRKANMPVPLQLHTSGK
jgi:hypothetical protein